MNKYRNIKTDGYHSKREAKRAAELKLLLKAGLISELNEQVAFELAPSVHLTGKHTKPRKHPPMRYIADFTYLEDGKFIVEDVKGLKTPDYRIKSHLMMWIHGVDIKET